MSKVLVVATSRKTRGGITAVIKAHESGAQWKKYHCHWVQTHRDGPAWRKIAYFIVALLDYCVRLPFYDIVHIHMSQNVTARRKTVFMRFAKLCGKRVIVHFHAFDVESTIKGSSRDKYEYLFKNADRLIVLSEWWKDQVLDEFEMPAEKVQVIYNPCPIVSHSYNSKKEKCFLYAGTINQRKGYSDLLTAFAKIANKYPNWKVVFAGNGEVEHGLKLAEDFGIKEQTVFLGWISGEAKAKAFQEASVFCLPSYAEGFPMAVLDAWAYGLPVITTPVGGIPDVAEDGKNMLLFNPGDVTKLAEQLERMITDTALRERIAAASVDFATNKFNVVTINRQIGELYESLLK